MHIVLGCSGRAGLGTSRIRIESQLVYTWVEKSTQIAIRKNSQKTHNEIFHSLLGLYLYISVYMCIYDQCLCLLYIDGKGLWITLDKMITMGNTIFVELGLTAAFNSFLAPKSKTYLSFSSVTSTF